MLGHDFQRSESVELPHSIAHANLLFKLNTFQLYFLSVQKIHMATMTELTQAAAFLTIPEEATAAVETLHGSRDRIEMEYDPIAR